ncbi:MAG: hypothetical protein J2P21_22790 [Chloracidobacterium sp.]|nr:hypothetical protein [Chloracidobacterium sp.]
MHGSSPSDIRLHRALRADDQRRFDELFEHVRRNTQAAVMAAAPEPVESVVLLMLIGMQKEIEELKARVSEFESKEPFALVAPNEDQKLMDGC